MTELYIPWRHAETGQHYVTQTAHDGDHPRVITRPVYPDAPPVDLRRPAPKPVERAPTPPPAQPALPVGLDEPFVPATARTAASRAQAHGWSVRLTKAEGPRIDGESGVFTLGMRCDRPRARVILAWKWKLVTRAPKGRPSYQEYAWATDGAWIMPPRLPVPVALATRALEEWDAVQEELRAQRAVGR